MRHAVSSPSLSPAGRFLPGWLDLSVGAWLVIAAYAAILTGVALSIPFPTRIDEIAHYSMIRALHDQPTLFPDWSRYLLLREDDLLIWSQTHNYINHPPLYYLLLAPLLAVSVDPLLFRLANVLISTLALLIMVLAVRRCFATDSVSPTWFGLIAASFPKAAVVGGLINNDNLAVLAGALLFAGVIGLPATGWWIMIGLALAGWTKLTALVALAAVMGAWLGMRLVRGELRLSDPLLRFAVAGLAIGVVPYLVNLVQSGHLLWVNQAVWRVPLAQRADYDLAGFAGYFLRAMLFKWPAAEGAYPLALILGTMIAALGVAALGLRVRAVRSVGLAYLAGIVALLLIHFVFGWRSFQAMGDLTIAQTRYYNILWPGVALAAAAAMGWLARLWRPAPYAAAALYLAPTLIGSAVLALV